jgi:hypothetical protein
VREAVVRVTKTVCTEAQHDHEGYDESGSPNGTEAECPDCGRPAFYDYSIEQHVHVEREAQCFLIGAHAEALPCKEES